MNNQDSEIERSLTNAVPLPCSIDPMQLMFDAGVEDQKRKSKRSRRPFVVACSLSCVLMLSTLALAAWSFHLVSQNSDLHTAIKTEKDANDRLRFIRNQIHERSLPGSSDNNDLKIPQSRDESDQQKGYRNRKMSDESLLFTYSPNVTRDSAVQDFMLRGVALRPEDEYRFPTRSERGTSVTSRSSENQSGSSNMKMRQLIQSDLLGL